MPRSGGVSRAFFRQWCVGADLMFERLEQGGRGRDSESPEGPAVGRYPRLPGWHCRLAGGELVRVVAVER
jgi:hypothetical protein